MLYVAWTGWVDISDTIGLPQTGPYMKDLKKFKVSLGWKQSTGKYRWRSRFTRLAGIVFCFAVSLFLFLKGKTLNIDIRASLQYLNPSSLFIQIYEFLSMGPLTFAILTPQHFGYQEAVLSELILHGEKQFDFYFSNGKW